MQWQVMSREMGVLCSGSTDRGLHARCVETVGNRDVEMAEAIRNMIECAKYRRINIREMVKQLDIKIPEEWYLACEERRTES